MSAREGRITFGPSSRASEALATAQEMTGDNQTDTINRALVIYAKLLHETQAREPRADKGSVVVYLTDKSDPDSTEQVVFV